jgi:hypothetical protein
LYPGAKARPGNQADVQAKSQADAQAKSKAYPEAKAQADTWASVTLTLLLTIHLVGRLSGISQLCDWFRDRFDNFIHDSEMTCEMIATLEPFCIRPENVHWVKEAATLLFSAWVIHALQRLDLRLLVI